jgi:hypothetical protein
MVHETLTGTTSTKGSRSGRAGLIDSEEDAGCEGFDLEKLGIITTQREAGWDTDQDGIPNWFEALTGTSPDIANNNEDRDGDYYTDLEEYLNWIAVPNFRIDDTGTLTLADYFAGYTHPSYTISAPTGVAVNKTKGILTVTPSATASTLFTVKVKATEDGISLERDFHFAFNGGSTAIHAVNGNTDAAYDSPFYDLQGHRVSKPAKGIYIQNGKKRIMR